MQKKSVLWLDGHWSQGGTARGALNTPIVQELRSLKSCIIKNNIILIDDIRFFQKPPKKINDIALEGYPDLNELIDIIQEVNSDYSCWVYGDVLIAFPDLNISVPEIIAAMTISRLNSGDEKTQYDAERTIAHATQQEREILKNLCFDFSNTECCFTNYYHFWYALSLLHSDKQLAQHHMQKAKEGGCNRAEYYLKFLSSLEN